MTGFSVHEVRAKGPGMQDAAVRFDRGLSLLTGPSDTGKSFVGDAINHVFGRSSSLRQLPPEQSRYDRLLVEIKAYETGATYTLIRRWMGGTIELYECTAKEAETVVDVYRTLKDEHDSTVDSVSGFLLSLSGLLHKQLRKNATGTKDNLSFRNLPPYVLVEEDRIITKTSPILHGGYAEETKEKSLFKLLLTGSDDSGLKTINDPKTRKGLDAGRKDVLDTLLLEARQRTLVFVRTENEIRADLAQVEESLVGFTLQLRGASAQIEENEAARRQLWDDRKQRESRLEQVQELLRQFSLLDEHYSADIERLISTQESGRLLMQISEVPCPLCGAEPKDHKHEGMMSSEEVESLIDACAGEQRKLVLLRGELSLTLTRLTAEETDLSTEIQALEASLLALQNEILKDLEPTVKASKDGLESLYQERRELERGINSFDEVRRIESLQSSYDAKSKVEKKEKVVAEPMPTSATDDLAALIGQILKAWNYPNFERVAFDSQTQDILVNGKPRGSHGKGYRAITYAAFVVGVMIFCRQRRLPHPGFIVLDSPLVTYRKPDKVESSDDLISEGMVPHFYSYLANLNEDCQVILIENDSPGEEIEQKTTSTHFSKNQDLGRFGFLYPPIDGEFL